MLAYLDPGSGALIWQLLLSAAAGMMLLFWRTKQWTKSMLDRLGRLFKRNRP